MSEALVRRAGDFVWSKGKVLRVGLPTLCSAMLLLPLMAAAQEFRATVTGTVADPSGAKIAGAKVDIKNQGTGVTVSTVTTSEGTYATPFLEPGRYSVT